MSKPVVSSSYRDWLFENGGRLSNWWYEGWILLCKVVCAGFCFGCRWRSGWGRAMTSTSSIHIFAGRPAAICVVTTNTGMRRTRLFFYSKIQSCRGFFHRRFASWSWNGIGRHLDFWRRSFGLFKWASQGVLILLILNLAMTRASTSSSQIYMGRNLRKRKIA